MNLLEEIWICLIQRGEKERSRDSSADLHLRNLHFHNKKFPKKFNFFCNFLFKKKYSAV